MPDLTDAEKAKLYEEEKAKKRRDAAKGLIKESVKELYEEERKKKEPPKRDARGFLDYLADLFGFAPDVVEEKKEEKKA